ncbi:MATE family efflux transporter [Agathobacter sp.]
MKTNEIDMVNGPLARKILLYSIPLMFSNLLQVFFNMTDVAVVGKFAGARALGSVGSTTIIITLTTGILLGMGGGVNAVTALHMGAERYERVHKTVHTSIILCFIAGLLLLIAGLVFSKPLLEAMNTKPELIDGATAYLMIYLCGSPALAIYNFGNGVLSAVGDTKRPLIYLSISGVLNIILNLFFVIVCRLGVIGVAIASIIAQYLSAALIINCLRKTYASYGLRIKDIAIDKEAAVSVLRIGVPAAIQYSLFAIANICIQTSINSFSHVVVEGNSAATNADSLIYDMMAAFYTACTSFIAQNLGARKKSRILKTYFITLAYSFMIALFLGTMLFIFQKQFLSMFTSDPDVIKYGEVRIGIMAFVYCISAFMDDATAAARGLGKSVMPTIIVVMGSVVFRIIWLLTVFAYFATLESIYLVYVSSWTLTAIAGNIYFAYHYRKIPKEIS